MRNLAPWSYYILVWISGFCLSFFMNLFFFVVPVCFSDLMCSLAGSFAGAGMSACDTLWKILLLLSWFPGFPRLILPNISDCCKSQFIIHMINIQKYLPKSYEAKLQTQKSLVGFVQKRNAQKCINILKNVQTQMNQLTHLKRIHKKQQDKQFLLILLCLQSEPNKEDVLAELKQFIVKVQVVEVPFNPPNTKQEYQEWSKIWPITFVQQQVFKPIKHSQQQHKLVSQIVNSDANFVVFSEQRVLFNIKEKGQCQEGTIHHPIMNLLQEWPKTQAFKDLPSAYYLTKLRLLCKTKLCGMCSMALVHSRLDRIYFLDVQIGEQMGQILSCPKLNHRVKIFRVSAND